jgi:hypothetical protein
MRRGSLRRSRGKASFGCASVPRASSGRHVKPIGAAPLATLFLLAAALGSAPPAGAAPAGVASAGASILTWPKLVVTAMADAARTTHVPLEAPRSLPAHNPASLVANSAAVGAGVHDYDVTLKDCSPPVPLNSSAMSSPSGSCTYQMALFGSFGAQAYGSHEAASAALAAQTATDVRPFSACTRTSHLELAGKVEATVNSWGPGSGGVGPCKASWEADGWTFVISGMTPYLWVGGVWTVTADQIIAYTEDHALPGQGEMDSTNAGDGLITTLTWASGADLYNTFAYHGALTAVEMASSMAPYPGPANH